MKIYSFLIVSLLFTATLVNAQAATDNWITIEGLNVRKISVNVTGLERFKGNDFYVNVIEDHNPPLIMEAVDGKIYKTKTYYLMNKNLLKYSIVNITYYDIDNNVLKNYNYQSDSEIEEYKYNYPILPESDAELILNACLKYSGQSKSNTN